MFNDPRTETTDESAYVDLTYQRQLANEIELTARLSFNRYRYDGVYPFDMANVGDPPLLVLNRDASRGEWWGGEVKANRQFFDRHTLTAGVEYRDNFRQDQSNYYEQPGSYSLDDRRESQTVGLYGQGEFMLWTNLLFNAGVRYDYGTAYEGTVNPRLGLIYSPWAETTFKLLYGRAFRAPNVYELFYQDGTTTRANPDLLPERIHTYELVYEQGLRGPLRLNLAGYYYTIDDLITQQTNLLDGMFVFENIQKIQALGIEAGLEAKHENGWAWRLSYARQRAEQVDTQASLSNSPEHLAKLNVIAPLVSDKLFAGLELQYSGAVTTWAGGRADEFWIANVTLFNRKLVKGLELSASVYNLFDQRYGYPGAGEHTQDVLWQDGRTFRVKLTYRF
ncbi:MAG: TonB-dependent receptor [Verrucomicrobiota bacterium]